MPSIEMLSTRLKVLTPDPTTSTVNRANQPSPDSLCVALVISAASMR
jgi:hypothetical protein